jgi:hypothetical protein
MNSEVTLVNNSRMVWLLRDPASAFDSIQWHTALVLNEPYSTERLIDKIQKGTWINDWPSFNLYGAWLEKIARRFANATGRSGKLIVCFEENYRADNLGFLQRLTKFLGLSKDLALQPAKVDELGFGQLRAERYKVPTAEQLGVIREHFYATDLVRFGALIRNASWLHSFDGLEILIDGELDGLPEWVPPAAV